MSGATSKMVGMAARRGVHSGRTGLGRPYQALWTANAISTLGDGVRTAALPLLAASISRKPSVVAAVSFAGQVPWLLVSLASGAIADRLDRRTVMWVVDTFRALVMVALAGLVVVDESTVAVLCAVAFLLGTGQTLFDSASHALLPSLVRREDLLSANGRMFGARIVINNFLGPPVGSMLFALAAATPFLLDAGSFAGAALLVGLGFGHRVRTEPVTSRRSIPTEIGEGLRWVWASPVLRKLGGLIAVVNFTQAATQSILVLFALEKLGLTQRGYGLLLAAVGIGGAVGGLFGERLRRRLGAATLFTSAVLLTIPVFVGLGMTSNPFVAAGMLALNACLGVTANVLMNSLRQAIVPNRLLARVNSVMGLLGVGISLPTGSLASGVLADRFGLRAPFFVSAALIACAAVLVPRVSASLAHSVDSAPRH